MNLLSWNMAHRPDTWRHLVSRKGSVALLQEACAPPAEVASQISTDSLGWQTSGSKRRNWRTAIVSLDPSLKVDFIPTVPLCDAKDGQFGVSRPGSLAAAHVTSPDEDPITVVSMYGLWEKPVTGSGWIYADASVHRLISDISVLVGRERGHRIIAAGDLNILFRYGEHGSPYWKTRYQTIFDRFESIGLEFIGPQSPNGRSAEPWPAELPLDSLNVPTYHTTGQTPATATRQLDFVFASRDIAKKVNVRALNGFEEWGPSDHCMVEIAVD